MDTASPRSDLPFSLVSMLLAQSTCRIIELAMEDRGLTVYSRSSISNASPEDLVRALSGKVAEA